MAGNLNEQQMSAILDAMPYEMAFVDDNDRLQYMNQADTRQFGAGGEAVGRDVRACHSEASLPKVEEILSDLRNGKADEAWFWISTAEPRLLNRFIALRDKEGEYLGILEYVLDFDAIEAIAEDKKDASAP